MTPLPTRAVCLAAILISLGGLTDVAPAAVVLLRGGGVLCGAVRIDGDDCIVSNAGAETIVDTSQVAMIAEDLPACYQRQSARLTADDADARARLAWWCLDHSLVDQAEREIALIARAAPGHDQLRDLYVATTARRKAEELASEPAQASVAAAVARAYPAARRVDSAASSDDEREFREVVEPLLLKHCGTTHCHGARSHDGLRLLGTGENVLGTTRLQSQVNLRAVRDYLDQEAPDKSRLLVVATAPHGQRPAAPLTAGDPDYQAVVAWVYAVAGSNPPPIEPRAVAARIPEPAGYEDEFALLDAAWAEASEDGELPPNAGRPAIEEPAARTPADPMDPVIYNRRQSARRANSTSGPR